MDVMTTLSWADTALTVAQIGLFVGCPTAAVGWLALRAAAKVALKKAIVHAVAVGATATAAASAYVLSHGGGGGGGNGSSGPVLSEQVLAQEMSEIQLKLDAAGQPFIKIDGEKINKDDLVRRLLEQKGFGKLKQLTLRNELGRKHGEWELHIRSVAGQLSLPVLSAGAENE